MNTEEKLPSELGGTTEQIKKEIYKAPIDFEPTETPELMHEEIIIEENYE